MTPVSDNARHPDGSQGGEALVPDGWLTIEGLVCGFGHRTARAPGGTLLLERQVHGIRVVDVPESEVPRRDAEDGYPRIAADADALVAARPGTVVGVRTADCVPLLLVAPRARWAAAVHAGWRGTLAGIATEAVQAAGRAGIAPHDLVAAIGPAIGPCCYEVSTELGEEFARAGIGAMADRSPVHGSGKPRLDLRAANRFLLERSGVPAQNIQTIGPCTRCALDRFHSFRAEPDSAGRQVSWVGWKKRPGG